MFLGADKYLERLRYTDGSMMPKYTREEVQKWYDDMPSLRIGELFELVKIVKCTGIVPKAIL